MTALDDKAQLLERSGYRYHFSREVYFNRRSRKVFSREAIEDYGQNWLEQKIAEKPPANSKWAFYFKKEPAPVVKDTLIAELR